MGRNETAAEQVTEGSGFHQLLVLGGLALFVTGLFVTGVFGGMLPSPLADLDGAEEPPIDDDAIAPAEPDESPSSDDGDPGDDEPAGEMDDDTPRVDDGSPAFEIAAFASPDTASAGDVAEVSIELVNRGDAEGSTNVTLAFSGDTIERETVTLEPDESATLRYDVDTAGIEPGRHEVEVTAADDVRQTWIEIEEDGTSSFAVSDLEVPSNATVGDEIEVEYTIRNTGEVSGTGEVHLEFGNGRLATETMSLDPQESTTVTTDINTSGYEEGRYSVLVRTPDAWDRDWITLQAQSDEEDDSDDEDEGAGDDDGSDDDDANDGDDEESDDDGDEDDGDGDDDDEDGTDDDDDDDDDDGIIDF